MALMEILQSIPGDISNIYNSFTLSPTEHDIKFIKGRGPFGTIVLCILVLIATSFVFTSVVAAFAPFKWIVPRIRNHYVLLALLLMWAAVVLFLYGILLIKIWAYTALNEYFMYNTTAEIVDFLVAYPVTSSIACFIIGALAYALRCRSRLIYASVEMLVGVFASYSTSGFQDPVGAIQFLGGIYIIVRAFDNMNKGLEQKNIENSLWSLAFGKNR